MLAAPGNPLPSWFQGSCLSKLPLIALDPCVKSFQWPMRIMFRAPPAVKLPTYALCPIRYRLRPALFEHICEGQ